jgi:cell division protein FtsA
MKLEDPIGIIELGDVNLKCLIFKINKENNLEILSSVVTESDGIQNELVVNLKKASNAIRSIISKAEKIANISLKKINVVFEQPDFLCTNFSKHKKIDGSKIQRHDIEFLLREGKKQLTLNDKTQSIIHIFNHNYIVDGKIFAEEPIEVFADTLSHEMTFITAPINNLKNINQAFIECDIEIERLISQTFALGAKLFDSNELRSGSVLINLESKKISLGIFKNLALVHSTTSSFGIDYITSDISKVCSLNLEEAEKIINNFDFSFQNNQNLFDENNYLKSIFFIKSNFRKISKKLILDVVKARLDEIFEMLKKQLFIPGFNFNSGFNFLLVGEGTKLSNLGIYTANFFSLNVNKIDLFNNKDHDDLEKNFASCFGALKIIKDGWETEAIPKIKEKNIGKIGFFSKIFGHS